jgi:hypothetical protein
MFYRWQRMSKENKKRVWKLYGWLCALTAIGSCVGIITYVAKMQQLAHELTRSDLAEQRAKKPSSENPDVDWHRAQQTRWNAVYVVSDAAEFLFLTSANLLVLDRMSDFAIPDATLRASDMMRWKRWGKGIMAAVVIGNLIGLAANAAAAHYYVLAYSVIMRSYSVQVANGGNRTSSSLVEELRTQRKDLDDTAYEIVSVQLFCEASVLLLVVAVFFVVGTMCRRRLKAIMQKMLDSGARASASAEGAHLNKQLVITTGFVFVTFLIRTVYAFMQALANKLSNLDTLCPGNTVGFCNPECYNMWSHMYVRRLPLRVFVTVWSGTAGSVRRPSLNRPWRSFLHPLRFSLGYGA